MTIVAIDHVQLAMPPGGEAQARRFYADLLGFSESTKPAELAARGGAWFACGNVHIHLGVDSNFLPASKAHPAFLVEGLESLLDSLRRASVVVDTSQPPLDGYRRVHVFDPFGNRLELMERLK